VRYGDIFILFLWVSYGNDLPMRIVLLGAVSVRSGKCWLEEIGDFGLSSSSPFLGGIGVFNPAG
jgi:hypothetical protein